MSVNQTKGSRKDRRQEILSDTTTALRLGSVCAVKEKKKKKVGVHYNPYEQAEGFQPLTESRRVLTVLIFSLLFF